MGEFEMETLSLDNPQVGHPDTNELSPGLRRSIVVLAGYVALFSFAEFLRISWLLATFDGEGWQPFLFKFINCCCAASICFFSVKVLRNMNDMTNLYLSLAGLMVSVGFLGLIIFTLPHVIYITSFKDIWSSDAGLPALICLTWYPLYKEKQHMLSFLKLTNFFVMLTMLFLVIGTIIYGAFGQDYKELGPWFIIFPTLGFVVSFTLLHSIATRLAFSHFGVKQKFPFVLGIISHATPN